MNVNILADFNWESKLDHVMRVVDLRGIAGDFGTGLQKILICLMCRDPELEFKQRARHTRADAMLAIDVMLDLPFFISATHVQRRAKVAEQIGIQMRAVFVKKRIKDFDADAFLECLDAVLTEQLNGSASTRFDAYCLERATGF
jgi:hypothetical protein